MTSINLLPWREDRKRYRNRRFYAVLSMASMVAGMGILAIHLSIQYVINQQEDRNNYVQREISAQGGKIAQVKKLKKEKESLMAHMGVIQLLEAKRPYIVNLFDSIARSVPEGIYLTEVTRSGNEILISGVTVSNSRVSIFMRNLERLGWLANASLGQITAKNQIGFILTVTDVSLGATG